MERQKAISLCLFGVILLMGLLQLSNTIATTFEGYEQKINQSYIRGLSEGFGIGQEFQSNATNDYIIQSLQQQGFINFPVVVGNETGNLKLVVGG